MRLWAKPALTKAFVAGTSWSFFLRAVEALGGFDVQIPFGKLFPYMYIDMSKTLMLATCKIWDLHPA